jgi:hypothetical protein
MKTVKLTIIWAAFIGWAAFSIWFLFSHSNFIYLEIILNAIGLSNSIIQLIFVAIRWLMLLYILEILAKFFIVEKYMPPLKPLKFTSTQVKSWHGLDCTEVNHYTSELEQLGFIHLTDYSYTSIQGMARLFAHPQKYYFAEIGQISGLPTFCSTSCRLEQHWSLTVANNPASNKLNPVWYAFMRQPRALVKHIKNAPASTLLEALTEWQQQISIDLRTKIISDVTVEAYFKSERQKEMQQTASLVRKSVIWGLIEIILCSLNSKSEWLGDYAKLKQKR